MAPHKNVILIGMPGVGKSTAGVLLAKQLKYSFLDTDIYIQTREGKSLQEIIHIHGTAGFCDIEEQYILSVELSAHVIAPGGSVVYRPKAMKHLATSGLIIHLDLALDRLKQRLDDIDARGVVIAPGQTIEDLHGQRHPLYMNYADFTVITDGLRPDQIVGEIMEIITISK